METKFNFNSQVCTSKVQSERLLALGLKKETADCGHFYGRDEYSEYSYWSTEILDGNWKSYWDVTDEEIPAWSLHRLLCLYGLDYTIKEVYNNAEECYGMLISAIGIAIEDGDFPNEYLE